MKRKMTPNKDKNLVTITGLSDESTIDRRTIRRYAAMEGLEPVARYKGGIYYDRNALIEAMAKHREQKPAEQSGPIDATAFLKDAFSDLAMAQGRMRLVEMSLEHSPGSFFNIPANHADIQNFVRSDLLKAVSKCGNLIGVE